jgi:hypothetical protein
LSNIFFNHEQSALGITLLICSLPWLSQFVNLSEQKPMFKPRPIHMRSEVDKEVMGQVFLQLLQFSPVSIGHFFHFGPVGFSSEQLGVIQSFISPTNAH